VPSDSQMSAKNRGVRVGEEGLLDETEAPQGEYEQSPDRHHRHPTEAQGRARQAAVDAERGGGVGIHLLAGGLAGLEQQGAR